MPPSNDRQVEILSAVSELMRGRTPAQVAAELERRFTYTRGNNPEEIVGIAQLAMEAGELLSDMPQDTLMGNVVGSIEVAGPDRFVKVRVTSAINVPAAERAGGMTDVITVHVPFTESQTIHELRQDIDAAVDQVIGDDTTGFKGAVSEIEILGVF